MRSVAHATRRSSRKMWCRSATSGDRVIWSSGHLKNSKAQGGALIMKSSVEEINVKEVVKEKYGQAALRVKSGGSSCCGATAAAAGSKCDPITSNLYNAMQTGKLPE